MLEDLRALVEFAHAGSIAGAADRLFRTPSAVTRQVQRLEAALGAELLDRSTMQESPTSVYSTLDPQFRGDATLNSSLPLRWHNFFIRLPTQLAATHLA